MATKGQLSGMRGVYLVAAELSKLGVITSPTSRSAMGADILATDQYCQKSYSIQVKTNVRTFNFWLVGKKAVDISSPTHIYVFVNIRAKKTGEEIEYFIVPSKVVANRMYADGNWPHIRRDAILRYKGKWSIFTK